MVVSENSFIFSTKLCPSSLLVTKNGRNLSFITLAKKRDLAETSKTQKRFSFQLQISNRLVAQSAIAVFSLGFIDAGYSGDWSRIGVISKESEDLLKVGAFIIVPLCLFFIFYLSKQQESDNS